MTTHGQLDDGWYDFMATGRSTVAGQVPNGDPDMVAFVRKVHDRGFRTASGGTRSRSPKSRLAKEHPTPRPDELGNYPLDPATFTSFAGV